MPRDGARGSPRFVEPLREVMMCYDGRLQIEAAAALFRLTGDAAARALLDGAADGPGKPRT